MMYMQQWMVPETRETNNLFYKLAGVLTEMEGGLFWAVTDKS